MMCSEDQLRRSVFPGRIPQGLQGEYIGLGFALTGTARQWMSRSGGLKSLCFPRKLKNDQVKLFGDLLNGPFGQDMPNGLPGFLTA